MTSLKIKIEEESLLSKSINLIEKINIVSFIISLKNLINLTLIDYILS